MNCCQKIHQKEGNSLFSIHEGNIADCNSVLQVIAKLASHTCNHKALVVSDAGIATEKNLELMVKKG